MAGTRAINNEDRAGSCGPGTLPLNFQLSTWPRRSWRHHTSTEYVPHSPAKKQQGPRGIFHETEGIEDAIAGMSVATDMDQVGRHIARNADRSCTSRHGTRCLSMLHEANAPLFSSTLRRSYHVRRLCMRMSIATTLTRRLRIDPQ